MRTTGVAAMTVGAALILPSLLCALSVLGQPIDTARSSLRIHIGKAGLLSAAGHEHLVTARLLRGALDAGHNPSVSFTVSASSLVVEPDPKLSESDRADVQDTMQTKVLESGKYPRIEFRSTRIMGRGSDTWDVEGDLSLHGVSRPITLVVQKNNGHYVGRTRIKQTDFAIRPVSVGAGLVKVSDEVEIEFDIVTAPTAN